MQRFDIINRLISRFDYRSYLEIGVRNPAECFDLIQCENKTSVDPGIEMPSAKVDYRLESDEFFRQLDADSLPLRSDIRWDLVFIDGLHISDQVLRDIDNSIRHLSPGGCIVLHDCNPPSAYCAREDYEVDGRRDAWNGTVWKAVYYVRTHKGYQDFVIRTVDTDWGVGIMMRCSSPYTIPPLTFRNRFFEYNLMAKNRERDLGLLAADQFEQWLDVVHSVRN